ncbi:hypothetical protein J2Z49_002955 [Desulfofundulus luciae]|uniref:4Fe-4S ferredoxin-type domain-containing protein n=1 Tax=Desulfofundulus luciae TaxID=74702 RepID=A0ABU0B538_9FIRM|nr:hypothetical protein [Desulfofundulus luciae]MDQ0287822.1 hypothetical protein [Desulfofundulus luciae]
MEIYVKYKIKQVDKMCILEEEKICDNCCDCFVCELNPDKICDNCANCLKLVDYPAKKQPQKEILTLEKCHWAKGNGHHRNRMGLD